MTRRQKILGQSRWLLFFCRSSHGATCSSTTSSNLVTAGDKSSGPMRQQPPVHPRNPALNTLGHRAEDAAGWPFSVCARVTRKIVFSHRVLGGAQNLRGRPADVGCSVFPEPGLSFPQQSNFSSSSTGRGLSWFADRGFPAPAPSCRQTSSPDPDGRCRASGLSRHPGTCTYRPA